MWYVRGCNKTLKIRNETVRLGLNILSINYDIEEIKTRWKYHVDRRVGNITKEDNELPAERKERFG